MNFTTEDKHRKIISLIHQSNPNEDDPSLANSALLQLKSFEKNQIAFSELLIDILCESQNLFASFTHNQILLVYIYIKNFLNSVSNKSSLQKIDLFNTKLEQIINIYFLNEYPIAIENIYGEIIHILLEIINHFENAKNIYNILIQKYTSTFPLEINNSNIWLFRKIVFVYESVYELCINYLLTQNEYTDVLLFYPNFYEMCIHKLTPSFMINVHNENKCLENLCKLLNCIVVSFSRTYILILDAYIKNEIYSFNYSKNKEEVINNSFIENDKILKFIYYIITLLYHKEKGMFMCDKLFLFFNNDNYLNKSISKGKVVLIELLSITCYNLDKFHIVSLFTKYEELLTLVSSQCILHLIDLYKSNNYPREKVDNSNEEIDMMTIIVKLLSFMETLCNSTISDKIFKHIYIDIFHYIIIPNIIITPLELDFFSFDVQEYTKHILDMAFSCDIKLPKHKSLRLLMSMCEHIDGFFTYITELYLKVLFFVVGTFQMKSDIINNDNEIYCFLTSKLSSKELLEQSLQVFTSVSFLFCERDNTRERFCDMIDIINHHLLQINDYFIQSKLCMFYAYNLKDLFNDGNEVLSKSFDDSLNFVFSCVVDSKCTSLNTIALNNINSIIFDRNIKSFCGTMVKIFGTKIVNFLQHSKNKNNNNNSIGYENDYNTFINGLIKNYTYELGEDVINLFEIFWDNLLESINESLTSEHNENNNRNNTNNLLNKEFLMKRKHTKAINNLNLVKSFLNGLKNQNASIKNHIYTKILNLLNLLEKFINYDLEKDIIDILLFLLNDLKLLPQTYIEHIIKYTNAFITNQTYSFEDYHITFILTFISCLKPSLLQKTEILNTLTYFITTRLGTTPHRTPITKIISDYNLYTEFTMGMICLYYNSLNIEHLVKLIEILFKRIDTPPKVDFDLNHKLVLCIFILLFQVDSFDILNPAKIEILIHLIINLYPVNYITIFEHEIICIGIGIVLKYIFTLGEWNEEYIMKLIKLNYNELKLIKQSSKCENDIKTTETQNDDEKEEIVNGKYTYNKRKEHIDYTLGVKIDFDFEENDNNTLSYKYWNDRDNSLSENDNDEMSNKNDTDDIYEEDSEDDDGDFDNYMKHSSDDDDFLKEVKKERKNKVAVVYKEFANQELKMFINNINHFQFFWIAMQDFQNKNIKLYNNIMSSFNEEQIKNMIEFKSIKKISIRNDNNNNGGDNNNIENKNTYLYRRIIKIKKKN